MAAARRGAAYVDTSVLVAILFGEPGASRARGRLSRYATLLASGLVEAELKAALRREEVAVEPVELLPALEWVSPERPLTAELDRVFAVGYLRGADAWHLACALYLDPRGRELRFETLDERQSDVADALGLTGRSRARRGR